MLAFCTVKLVVDAMVAAKRVVVALVASMFVADAFVEERLLMNPLVNVSPVPEMLVVEALVMVALAAWKLFTYAANE